MQAIFALGISTIAAFMDLRQGKVKNGWILFAWSTGVIYQMLTQGWIGIWQFLYSSMIPMLLLFPLFCFRMLGPGDIKLLSALGGIMGLGPIFHCIFISFFLGGIISLGILLSSGTLYFRLRHFAAYTHNILKTKQITPYYEPGSQPENIHFTIPILLGVILYAGGIY